MGHGIRKVFVFMGVNDIGMAPATAQGQQVVYQRLTQAYRQITTCCHSSTPKLEVAISTITPFMPPSDNYPTPWPFAHPLRENTRLKVNDWIRRHQKSDETTDGFDYLIDWAKVVCEPDEGSRIQAKYQLSDYLHLSFEGCRAMAEAVDLDIFAGAA
jgi:lysophospholipase L1-like esterase